MGVSATVLQLLKLPDGTVRVLVEGKQRGSLEAIEQAGTHLTATVALIDDAEAEGTEVAALMRSVIDQFENYAKLNRKLPAETAVQLSEIDDASRLADAVAGNVSRSEEHTSELKSLMRISYAVFCLKKKELRHTKKRRTSKL